MNTTTVNREYRFKSLDDLMEENMWMWAKLSLFKEVHTDTEFDIKMLIGEDTYILQLYVKCRKRQEK